MALRIANDVRARCTLFRQYIYEIEWLPEKHYVAGTQIELRSHCLRSFHSWRYVRMEVEQADITFRWKTVATPSEQRKNPERVIFRARLQYGIRRGQACKIWLTAIPPIWAGLSEILSMWIIDHTNAWIPLEEEIAVPEKEPRSECELAVDPGPVERFSVYSRPMPGTDGQVRTVLVPEDRFGNPSAFEGPVMVRLDWQGKTWPLEIHEATTVHLEKPSDTARLKVSIPMSALSPTENIANGLRYEDELVVLGNPVWPEPIDGLRAAFGEFHWHTEISGDGQRTIEEALSYARDHLNMDYAAPGDHNPRGEDWQHTVAALDVVNVPDDFGTFYGWENGTDRGHENYYFTDPHHPLVCGGGGTG